MKLTEIKLLVEHKQYNEALTECEKLLNESPKNKREILRLREYVFTLRNEYDLAVSDYETIFELNEGTIGDYYQGAFRCLYAKQFKKASDWFLVVLRMGDEQNEDWFKSATLFYLAYIEMELEHFDEADLYLDKAVYVEADIALPIPEVGLCNAMQLREEIERRKSDF